jgi:hypothetical protein
MKSDTDLELTDDDRELVRHFRALKLDIEQALRRLTTPTGEPPRPTIEVDRSPPDLGPGRPPTLAIHPHCHAEKTDELLTGARVPGHAGSRVVDDEMEPPAG